MLNHSDPQLGRNFEKEIALEIGGRLVPASGAGKYDKGDVESRKFLIDTKYTSADQYILKRKTISTITNWAREMQKFPAIVVGLGPKEKYAIVDFELFKEFDMTDMQTGLRVNGEFGSFEVNHIVNSAGESGFIDLNTFEGYELIKLQIPPERFRHLLVYLYRNRGYFGL